MHFSSITNIAAKYKSPQEQHITSATTPHASSATNQSDAGPPPPYTVDSPSTVSEQTRLSRDGATKPASTFGFFCDEQYIMKTPDANLTPEQLRLKHRLRIYHTEDAKLGPQQRKLKRNMVIMNTENAELDKEERKIKQRMILMFTPDENLTAEQRKAKKRALQGKAERSPDLIAGGAQALASGALSWLN